MRNNHNRMYVWIRLCFWFNFTATQDRCLALHQWICVYKSLSASATAAFSCYTFKLFLSYGISISNTSFWNQSSKTDKRRPSYVRRQPSHMLSLSRKKTSQSFHFFKSSMLFVMFVPNIVPGKLCFRYVKTIWILGGGSLDLESCTHTTSALDDIKLAFKLLQTQLQTTVSQCQSKRGSYLGTSSRFTFIALRHFASAASTLPEHG